MASLAKLEEALTVCNHVIYIRLGIFLCIYILINDNILSYITKYFIQSNKKQKLNDGSTAAVESDQVSTEALYEAAYAAIRIAHNDEAAEVVKVFIATTDTPDANEFGVLPPSEDKIVRTKIHNIVKDYFGSILTSDTIDDPAGTCGKCVRIYRQGKRKFKGDDSSASHPARDKRGGSSAWPKDRPTYLKFVMHKFNKDTIMAIKDLAFHIRRSEKFFSYAGTKDRRAFTSQYVTGKYVNKETMKGIASRLQDRGLFIGNMEYVKDELRLGDVSVYMNV